MRELHRDILERGLVLCSLCLRVSVSVAKSCFWMEGGSVSVTTVVSHGRNNAYVVRHQKKKILRSSKKQHKRIHIFTHIPI